MNFVAKRKRGERKLNRNNEEERNTNSGTLKLREKVNHMPER